MPKMGITKQEIDERNISLDNPVKQVVFGGFKPKKSKNGDSINLNPDLTIIGDAHDNGKKVFYNLNFQPSTWFMVQNFLHMFGIKEESDGNGGWQIPGDWTQPTEDPSTWKYSGPLQGKTGKLELVKRTFNGQEQFTVKQMLCALPGCTEKHKDNLVKD